MTKTIFLFSALLCMGLSTANGQIEIECSSNLSIFHELVKTKNYDVAYEPWQFVNQNCPELSIAIYSDGEKILKHKLKNSQGSETLEFVEELIALWENRMKYFPGKTAIGDYSARICQLRYDHKELLGKTQDEQYYCFDTAFNSDKTSFTHPKSLYTYFSLAVDLFDSEQKTSAELFDRYDEVTEKIEDEIKNYSEKLNALLVKLEKGLELTRKEKNKKEAYESYLQNYKLISQNIDIKMGIRSNCENLIPLYTADFDARQNDSVWLKRAVSRMYHKECTESPLYEKLVKQYDAVSPSADTKLYVVTVLINNGKDSEINQYLNEAYELETDTYKKGNLAYRIGTILKKKGAFYQARDYFRKSLQLNPSNGKPHLAIAAMYSDSANDCGTDNFTKRAVYWLAAKEAKKAPKADPALKSASQQYAANYESKAPTKQDIFLKGMEGKTIDIGCWINSSIVVPKL